MGGRGANSGVTQKYTNNVVPFNRSFSGGGSSVDGGAKWDYRGMDQRISQLSNALSSARSASKINAVAKGLKALDKTITAEIGRVQSGAEKDGSLTALYTKRRKVRQLMQKARF